MKSYALVIPWNIPPSTADTPGEFFGIQHEAAFQRPGTQRRLFVRP